MKKGLLSLVGLVLFAWSICGCGGEGGLGRALTFTANSSRTSNVEITYTPYLEQMKSISLENAKNAVKNKDYRQLKKSIRSFIDNKQIDEAEKYAAELYRIDEEEGRVAYEWLQIQRDSLLKVETKTPQ